MNEGSDQQIEILYTRKKLKEPEKAASHHRAMSLHLARALDEIGLNTITVKKRRHTFLCTEQLLNVYGRFAEDKMTTTWWYLFGSQTEGATTPGLQSDVDTLHCDSHFNVIEDLADWKPALHNLLMLQENTAPGYCRLQLLRSDVPIGCVDLPNELYVYDDKGRVLLKNTCFYTLMGEGLDRNGPAQSGKGNPGKSEFDRVYAFRCNNWPRQAKEFTRRHRPHNWPPQCLIKYATRHGVFLVPVGYKLSPTEPLEWRISASLSERYLMFSLNIVHIKCYVVLKILMKTFVGPRIQKCISSYHCKTALLYCMENTEPGFWREDNLLPCVIMCLEMLRQWVADLFCPQFMIRDENLFAGKVSAVNRDLLLSILNEMIESDGRVLLRVATDNLGQRLQAKLNTVPSCTMPKDTLASVEWNGMFELIMQIDCGDVNSYLHTCLNSGDEIFAIRSSYLYICRLQAMVERSDKHGRQAIKSYIMFLSCLLGSMLASLSLANKTKVPRKAVQLICTAAKYDVSSMMKLASIFYCTGKFRKAEALLQRVEDSFLRGMLVLCCCYYHANKNRRCVNDRLYILKGRKNCARLFAHCVRFSRHEIHCALPALRHELYRAVGEDMEQRHPDFDRWMNSAVVDCLPYMLCLQYLTYKQLGKHDLQARSLLNLERCARIDEYVFHRETVWNLLGQCWESEQEPNIGVACYLISLEIKQRNNAANNHIRNTDVRCPMLLAWSMGMKEILKLLLIPFLDMVATRMPAGTELLLLLPLLPMAKRVSVSMRELARFQHLCWLKLRNLFK